MTLPRLCFLLLLLCPRISAQEAEVTVADYPAFVGQGGCGADEFRCNSGTCIPFAQVRDCNNDCPDAEDEACPESTPLATWTLCDDALPCENRRGPRGCGRCALRVNQAFPSCLDRYFEGNVNVLGFKPCATTVNWVPEMPPDGEDDCGDGTDEDACLIPDFTGQTACPGQACVFDRCAVPWPSGFNQYLGPFPATTTAAIVCSPLATTAAPTTPSPTMAPPAPSDPCAGAPGFACTDGSACVPTDQINDGTAQCGDASDELCLDPAAAAALCPSGGSCLYDPASETFGCACPANTLPNDRSVCLPDFASLPGDCSEVGTTGTAVVYRDDPTCVTLADCQAVVECPDAAGSSLGLDPSTPLGPGWTLVAENLEAGGPKSGAEYEQGFNDSLTKTTFAGLEYLDRLTGDPAALPELAVLVEFENASIPPKLIKYESFEVGPKASDYALVLGNQVTEQGLGSLVNGAPFSTSDSGSASSCASSTNVSWWWADSCDAQASLAPVPGLILGGQVVKDVKVLAKPPVECAPDEWECTELGECVPQTAVADGTANCFDGTDEAACGGDAALAATCDPDGCVFVPSAGAFQCAPCPELTKLSGSRCEPNTAALPSDCSQTALTGPTAVYNQQGCSTVAECKAADVICPAVGGSGETVVPADSGLGSGWTMIARSGSGGQLNPAAVLNKTLDEFGTGFGSPDAGPFVAGMDYASELTGAQPTEAAVLVTLSDGSKRIVRYAEVEVADKAGEYALTVGPQADVAAATAALGSSLQSGPLSTADSGQGQDCAATLGLGWWLSGAADCATAARDSMAPAAGLQVDGLEVTDVQLLLRPTQECGSAFACADGNGCAVLSSVRDGRPDCLDGSDEDPGCGLAQGATPACNPATCVFDPTIAEFACPPCPAQYAADEGLRCRPDFGALPLDCTHPSAPSAGGAFDVYADDGLCMTLDDCRLTVQCQPDPADPASPQDWILVKEQAAPASTPPPNDWATYAGGFGSVGSGSYFVGLDDLRKLALQGPMKLRLALTPSDPALDPVYLDYEDFALGTEAEGYALSLGTLVQESLSPPKDLLRASVGEPFSTADRGPDAECASSTGVGWWFPAPCGKDGTCGPCDEEGNLGEMPGQVVWDGVPMDAVRILLQPIPRNACQKQGQFQCKFVTSQCIDDRFVIDGNQLECDPNVPGDECKCLDRSDENFCAFDPAFRQLRDCEADLGTRCVYNSERHEFNCQCPPGTFGNTTARDRFCLPDPTALPRNCEEVAALDPEARSQTTTIYPMVDKRNCLSRKQCESPTFCELGDLAGFGPGWTVIQSRSLQGPTFDRTAQDFAKGFGRPTGDDFYIGNEAVKELTMVGRQDVLLELTSPSGEKRYVKYNDFAVGPAPDYPLALGAQVLIRTHSVCSSLLLSTA